MKPTESSSLLRRFFGGLTENTFYSHLGVADPPLIEYMTELLCRFVRCDAVYRVRNLKGKRLDEVAEMMLEAEHRVGYARREVHRHIGDFTLYWTGVFPEALKLLQGKNRKDAFIDYCTQGKRAYLVASSIPGDDDEPDAEVLERLSQNFEMCAYGLSEVRREWDRRDEGGDGIPPLLIN